MHMPTDNYAFDLVGQTDCTGAFSPPAAAAAVASTACCISGDGSVFLLGRAGFAASVIGSASAGATSAAGSSAPIAIAAIAAAAADGFAPPA